MQGGERKSLGIRPAAFADARRLGATFARAFNDDPGMHWVLPNASTRVRRLERFFTVLLARLIDAPARLVLTTREAEAGAIWAPPGAWKLPIQRIMPAAPGMIGAIGAHGMLRMGLHERHLGTHHPREGHWYLATLATDPAFQGQGMGSALVELVLERCDEEGFPAYLETQNESNVAFYRARGFSVVGKLDFGSHAPPVWLLWREPAEPGPTCGRMPSSDHDKVVVRGVPGLRAADVPGHLPSHL